MMQNEGYPIQYRSVNLPVIYPSFPSDQFYRIGVIPQVEHDRPLMGTRFKVPSMFTRRAGRHVQFSLEINCHRVHTAANF
jgi:hypothetical protein